MKDVSKGEGRTVLFVSHNMGSISQLCSRALLLDNGKVEKDGNVQEVIDYYLLGAKTQSSTIFENVDHLNSYVKRVSFMGEDGDYKDHFDITERVVLEFEYVIKEVTPLTGFAFMLFRGGTSLFGEYSSQGEHNMEFHKKTGTHILRYSIPSWLLKEGKYIVRISCYDSVSQVYYKETPSFQIDSNVIDTTNKSYRRDREGEIIPPGNWQWLK